MRGCGNPWRKGRRVLGIRVLRSKRGVLVEEVRREGLYVAREESKRDVAIGFENMTVGAT